MKEATLQVRMNQNLKTDAEELYRRLGTSLAEAVRIFAQQSLAVGGLPFAVRIVPDRTAQPSMRGVAHKYAGKGIPAETEESWRQSAVRKYEQAH